MVSYRLYRLDGAGRIVAAEWLEAADDAAAQIRAMELSAEGGVVEVWARNRMITRVEPPAVAS